MDDESFGVDKDESRISRINCVDAGSQYAFESEDALPFSPGNTRIPPSNQQQKSSGEENEMAIARLSSEIDAQDASKCRDMFVFSNEKAGMKSVDKEHVNKVVYAMSKDSAYFKKAEKLNEATEKRIKKYQMILQETTSHQRERIEELTSSKVKNILTNDSDMSYIYVVLDMDMFFCAVEMRDNPSLRGKPVAVGGIGMISTANYVARKFGVRSAMPGFIAKVLCPDLIFVAPDMEKYFAVSKEVQEILRTYDPDLKCSIDEACMDITKYIDSHFSGKESTFNQRMAFAEETVERMRHEVFEKTSLTCSAGISANRILAKIASNKNKPNGQYMVPADTDEMRKFLFALPIREIPGIGKSMEKVLQETLNVYTVGDLWDRRNDCACIFSSKTANFLLGICLYYSGTRTSHTNSVSERKSISVERTFQATSVKETLLSKLRILCRKLSKECLEKGLVGQIITLKLKGADFVTKQKQSKLSAVMPYRTAARLRGDYGRVLEEVFFSATKALMKYELPLSIRLIGVRLTSLEPFEEVSFLKEVSTTIKDAFATKTKLGESVEKSSLCESQVSQRIDSPQSNAFLQCPICSYTIEGRNSDANRSLNAHLDECLNQPVLQNYSSLPTRRSGKSPCTIKSFFRK